MVTVIDLKGYSTSESVGLKAYQYVLTQGVLLRLLGHVVYFMPHYVISYEEIDKMINIAYEGGIKKLLR